MSQGPQFAEIMAAVESRGGAEDELAKKYGGPIEEWSEDGGCYVVRGHMPKRRFLRLLREWARDVWGAPECVRDVDLDGIDHAYAVLIEPDPFDEHRCRMYVAADEPGAFPITVAEV